MSTRGFIGFVVDGVEKIFTRGSDAYPREAGTDVLRWLTRNRDALMHPVPGGVLERVRALRVVSEGPKPTLADVEPLRNLLCAHTRIPENRTYFQQASPEDVLRSAWENLDVLVQAGLIPGLTPSDLERIRDLLRRHEDWARHPDSLDGTSAEELLDFVTWDLDTLLEAGVTWNGSDAPMDSLYCEWGYLINLDTSTFEVYCGFQKTPHTAGRFAHRSAARDGYYPVALVASWPLADLPDQAGFLAQLDAY